MFNPVNTSVTSQSIAPDARAAGMGDVGAATDPDVNSQHWNLAKYPFCISRAGVSLNYTPWLRQLVNDIDLAYVTGYYRIGDYGALSGSLRYFSLGTVYTDGIGEDESTTVKPYEMALDVAYSRMLSEHFSLGVGLRWIYSDLRYDYSEDSKPASAFSADIAMYYNNYVMLGNRECQLGLGATVTNIGSKISYYGDEESQFIPTNLRVGTSLMIPVDVCVVSIPTCRASRVCSRASAMPLADSRKSSRRFSGAWVPNIPTTTSLPCVPVITTRVSRRATVSTSPWVAASV